MIQISDANSVSDPIVLKKNMLFELSKAYLDTLYLNGGNVASLQCVFTFEIAIDRPQRIISAQNEKRFHQSNFQLEHGQLGSSGLKHSLHFGHVNL